MTDNQRDVLLALNLRQMQMCDSPTVSETGVFTAEVAEAARRSTRSAAVVLSAMRDFGWVRSYHGEPCGWFLTGRGVKALEADREAHHPGHESEGT